MKRSCAQWKWAAGLGLCWAVVACGGSQPAASSPSSNQAAAPAAANSANPCTDFVRTVCEEAGPDDALCGAVQQTSFLMSADACAAASRDVGVVKERLGAHRSACETLRARLCARFGEGELCDMVEQRVLTLPVGHCAQALDQIEGVVAELEQWQAARQPLSAEQVGALVAGDAPSIGPNTARVTLVEFSDFQCPFCARVVPTLHAVLERYPADVRIVFRQFPLSFHQYASAAARAALVAHDMGKFQQFHDRLFAHQSELGQDDLVAHAAAVGLKAEAFRKALSDDQYEQRVKRDIELGMSVHVQGTPTLFINGKPAADPTDTEQVLETIGAALK